MRQLESFNRATVQAPKCGPALGARRFCSAEGLRGVMGLGPFAPTGNGALEEIVVTVRRRRFKNRPVLRAD